MTFYGEVSGLDYVDVLAGPLSYRAVQNGVNKRDDGVTITLSVGDSVIFNSYWRKWLTTSDTVGGLKWGVRCSGTGTADVSDAFDPSWGTSATFATLPSLNVSTGTLTDFVFDASIELRDASHLAGSNGPTQLKLTVTSGSLVLDQVRLEIEPVGGIPAGRWSDWQVAALGQYAPTTMGIGKFHTEWNDGNGDPWPDTIETQAQASFSANQTQSDPSHHWGWAKHAVQFSVNEAALMAYRSSYQPLINSLAFGTDYLQVPGYSMNDNFQFFQYDPGGVNQLVGWVVPPVSLIAATSFDAGVDGGAEGTDPAAWRLGITYGGPVYALGDAVTTWPGDGSATLAVGNKTTAKNSVVATPTVPLGIWSFTFSAELTSWPPIWGVLVDNNVAFNFSGLWPYLAYQPPRFRYWIPAGSETPFLRSKSRDDGLGRSAGRGRGGSSRQSSGRGRSYL